MTIHHHPADEWLLSLAAGRVSAGASLLLATHLEHCARCRARLHTLQAVGGALLAESEALVLAPDAWARTLARIDAPPPAAAPAPQPALARPALPAGLAWPRALRACALSRWHWMGPGMRFSRSSGPVDAQGSVFLLRIGRGCHLPRHSHRGVELTQVLCGSFDDGRALFGPGDFDAADPSVHHQPVVTRDGECICLAYVSAPLRFDGKVAALIAGWVGM